MIEEKWRKSLSGKEDKGYILGSCNGCNFYPCEIADEHIQFAERRNISQKVRDGTLQKKRKKDEVDGKCVYVPASKVFVNGCKKKENDTKFNSSTGLLPYEREELQNACPMGKRYVTQVECGKQRVADGIGEHYKVQVDWEYNIEKSSFNRWEPSQPVFISAQTGQGKNYFVEKNLIPYIEELNYINRTKFKILILSNRLALRCQVNNRLNGNVSEFDEDSNEKIYSFKGVADVMTYQGLLNKREYLEIVQKKKQSKYIFVVCDEAHFFTSDAMFNPYTQQILSAIVNLFKNAVRIYMSATPYECLKPICEYEKQAPVFYHFKRDFDYLDVKTYSEICELYEMIVRSVERSETWLIFIDDKERCKRVKNEIETKGEEIGISLKSEGSEIGKVYAVSAESKKDEIYNLILHREELVQGIQVLITTSVLDNGVNLTGINNVVLSDMQKVKCLQMVGRARTNGSSDKKTLFVKRFDKKYVMNRICDLKMQRQAYHDFDLAYGDLNDPFQSKINDTYRFLSKYYDGDDKDWHNAKHWFGRLPEEPDKVFINSFARELMEKYLFVYENVLREIEDEMAEKRAFGQEKMLLGQKYLEYQLSWFGKMYNAEDDLTLCGISKAEQRFLDFLESYADGKIQINDEQKEEFKKEFTKLHDAAFPREDKNKDRFYSLNKMNKILEKRKFNYRVESKAKCWKILEYISAPEKTEAE